MDNLFIEEQLFHEFITPDGDKEFFSKFFPSTIVISSIWGFEIRLEWLVDIFYAK